MARGDGADAMTGPVLSSYPADLAECVGTSFRLGGVRTIEGAVGAWAIRDERLCAGALECAPF